MAYAERHYWTIGAVLYLKPFKVNASICHQLVCAQTSVTIHVSVLLAVYHQDLSAIPSIVRHKVPEHVECVLGGEEISSVRSGRQREHV